VQDGDKVRLKGRGPDGGDLVLVVHVGEHPHFTRDGNDLLLSLPITVGEAFRGGKVQVPTPDGQVALRIPKGVRSGRKLRLKGKGARRGKEIGDLIVQVEIALPSGTGEEVAEAIDRLESAYDGDLRADLKLD
jgi:curved DNA-binding protein